MRALRLSPRSFRRLTATAAILLGFIVVSGGAVRLTGSGLGCTDWPTCANGHVVAPLEFHAMVEFGNRAVTGALTVVLVLAALGSFARASRRRDLVWLSMGLIAGLIGEIVLGGVTVLLNLAPPLVMGHFILSMLLLWDAVVLHQRAGEPDGVTRRPVVRRDLARLGTLLLGLAGVVVFLGTVVTGTGPHPGSHGNQIVDRLPFSLHDVARVHGASVIVFLALTVLTTTLLVRERAPAELLRRAELLLAAVVVQGAIGYTQYFTGVPALLVGVHIAGAVLVWVAVIRLQLGLAGHVTVPVPQPVPGAPRPVLAST